MIVLIYQLMISTDESSESEDDDISSARMWVEEKTVCPATPRFDFTESPGILVVLILMKPLLNKGYCVTLDNYFSSPILTDTLVKYKTDSYGTINLNRKEVPSYVKKMIAVRSSKEEKLKPKIVVDYNDTMGGVDRAD
ncbi:piggyBac transposable element-derived protein 4 [Trichonephila clavipes]|nr:piggyBac transposable element-derived protein 4 [Trichonephila clavipes]